MPMRPNAYCCASGSATRSASISTAVLSYRGNDAFQTRDRSFLGTVGLFDELILPLKRGDNELWFAVSEGFGGWAVVAQLP